MSNLGKWTDHYRDVREPRPWGETTSYHLGAAFLADMEFVEDWGCGMGFMRTLVPAGNYRGIDGSESQFADQVVDLANYQSDVEAIYMRHVLEHNYEWEVILVNALASFRKKMVLVIYSPFADHTHERAFYPEFDVPDISFRLEDITQHFQEIVWNMVEVVPEDPLLSPVEHIFYLRRSPC